MRAVVYEEFGRLPAVREVADPEPPRAGVVIRVEATGLCRSDWHGWMGHDPDSGFCRTYPVMSWPVWWRPPGRMSPAGGQATG